MALFLTFLKGILNFCNVFLTFMPIHLHAVGSFLSFFIWYLYLLKQASFADEMTGTVEYPYISQLKLYVNLCAQFVQAAIRPHILGAK